MGATGAVHGKDSDSRSLVLRLPCPILFPILVSLVCLAAAFASAHSARQYAKPAAIGPSTLPLAPKARVVSLTSAPGSFTEPSIAVNPLNPKRVVVAFQVNAHASYSTDAGRTWHAASGTAPADFHVSGDPSVVYDNQGHAILCYIAFDRLGTTDYWAHNATRNGVFVRRSLDGGRTWHKKDVAVFRHPTVPGVPFEDKPYIAADDTQGPYAGNLYVGWTHFTLANSTILFSRSTDDGKSWSAPITISTQPGLPRDDTGSVEGFDAAIGPDGTIYAVWSNGTHVVLAISTDGGRHFRPSREIIPTAPSYFKPSSVDRGNGFPQIAIDPRGGKRGGPLYVCWSDYRNGDIDIFVSTSRDHGRSWGPAVRVNNDPLHDGADQFMQWATVDPGNGDLYVVFYDRRADPKNIKATITLARSTDRGHTFENYAWTRTPFDPQNAFIGDYSGLAALNGCVYGAWTEQVPAHANARDPAGQVPQASHSIVRVGMARFPIPGMPAPACP